MSLPDANRSKRVYPLLQNLDLENLAFATMQSTGEPIAIEEMNEDELRRLVLVNLARLSVKGEWNGLLTAGGGGGGSIVSASPNGDWQTGNLEAQAIGSMGWSASQATTTTSLSSLRQFYRPFVSALSGDLTKMTINVSSASAGSSILVGIYNADANDGNPTSLIGYGTFDSTSTGTKSVTSFSSTITLERGSSYWYAVVATSGSPVVRSMNATYSNALPLTNAYAPTSWSFVDYTNTGALSNPASTSTMRGGNGSYPPINVGLEWI